MTRAEKLLVQDLEKMAQKDAETMIGLAKEIVKLRREVESLKHTIDWYKAEAAEKSTPEYLTETAPVSPAAYSRLEELAKAAVERHKATALHPANRPFPELFGPAPGVKAAQKSRKSGRRNPASSG